MTRAGRIRGAILVTGASRGIGAAIVLELAKRGFMVGCVSRSGLLPDRPGDFPSEAYARLIPAAADIADELAFRAALQSIAAAGGSIGGLVNNAGVHREESSRTLSTESFEEILRVNTTGVFTASRDCLPYLEKQGPSLIVNIGSFYDKLGIPRSTAYCASKAAVGAMTRCLAAEWGRRGVAVLNIAPGYIETEINRDYLRQEENAARVASRTFTQRPGQVGEVARLVAAMFCEDIPFLTGETIYIDGGHPLSL